MPLVQDPPSDPLGREGGGESLEGGDPPRDQILLAYRMHDTHRAYGSVLYSFAGVINVPLPLRRGQGCATAPQRGQAAGRSRFTPGPAMPRLGAVLLREGLRLGKVFRAGGFPYAGQVWSQKTSPVLTPKGEVQGEKRRCAGGENPPARCSDISTPAYALASPQPPLVRSVGRWH